nr:MAG TPA: hypothetical protein [Inoviridae sp.]
MHFVMSCGKIWISQRYRVRKVMVVLWIIYWLI